MSDTDDQLPMWILGIATTIQSFPLRPGYAPMKLKIEPESDCRYIIRAQYQGGEVIFGPFRESIEVAP